MKTLSLFTILTLFLNIGIKCQENTDPSIIINQVLANYAGMNKYADSVVIEKTTKYLSKSKTTHSLTNYKSTFIRPFYFELEGIYSSEHYPVDIKVGVYYNLETEDSISWIKRGSYPTEKKTRKLSNALARTVGVIGGSVKLIPILLLPKSVSGANYLINFDTIFFLEPNLYRNEYCFIVTSINTPPENSLTKHLREQGKRIYLEAKVTYWIRKRDLLIIKQRREMRYSDKASITITEIYPDEETSNVKSKKMKIPD